MAMYYYASKISAIACGTHCRQNVLRKSRGQRDRDKEPSHQDELAEFHFANCEEDELNGNYAATVSGSEAATNLANGSKGSSGESGEHESEMDLEGYWIYRICIPILDENGVSSPSFANTTSAQQHPMQTNTTDILQCRRRFNEYQVNNL